MDLQVTHKLVPEIAVPLGAVGLVIALPQFAASKYVAWRYCYWPAVLAMFALGAARHRLGEPWSPR